MEARLLDGMPRTGSAKQEAAAASTERRSIIAGVGGGASFLKPVPASKHSARRPAAFQVRAAFQLSQYFR